MDSSTTPTSSPTGTGPVPTPGERSRPRSLVGRGLFQDRMAAVGWLLLIAIPLVLMPFDAWISDWIAALDLPGDLEKDMDAFQQFGQFGSLLLIVALICLLEPPAVRRTLLDLTLAILFAVGCAVIFKTLIGRARPYVDVSNIVEWNQQASMPSSHATAAAVLAVYLSWIRPRLALLAMILATLVAVWRVRVQAHFASDVAAGLLLGAIISGPVIRGHWGVRALDWYWKRMVKENNTPALPSVETEVRKRHPIASPARARSIRKTVLGLIALGVFLLILSVVHRPKTEILSNALEKTVSPNNAAAILSP